MPPDELNAYRKQIDALDDDIVALLERRAGLAKAVGDIKRARGDRVFAVPEREAQVLRRVKRQSALLKPHIQAIYREIISAATACETPLSAAYLGPAGTHTHEAALAAFGQATRLSAFATITAVVREAEKEAADFAVVPFENSAAGSVGETMDALADTPLLVVSELVRRIRHNLLVSTACADMAIKNLKTIYAHPQALQQCRRWLQKNAPKAALVPTDSNAVAAARVAAGEEAVAVIGSELAQRAHRLAVLAADIEDFSNNSTRFLVLGRRQSAASGDDKTLFIMTTRDEAGAMHKVLKYLADNGVTMTKLESRPSQGGLWKYLFFVEVVGHRQDPAVAKALAGIRRRATSLKILGSYPNATA